MACFAAGTRILTATGEKTVETLAVGEQVVTLSGRLRAIRWIGWRSIEVSQHPRPADVSPVLVQAHAFATGSPHRDLRLSPDHAVHWRGELIPVRYLCNGATVRQQAVAAVTYYHVELDAHDVVLADGLAAESYLDTGNRCTFVRPGALPLAPTKGLRPLETHLLRSRGLAPGGVRGKAPPFLHAALASSAR